MSSLIIAINRIKAALSKGGSAARWSMFYMALAIPGRILDSVLLKSFAKKDTSGKVPPIFIIVSAQRSGSTFTFQLLSRLIPTVYHSNLHSILPKYASSYLHKNELFGKDLKGFKNFYGHTAKINDINEGNGSLMPLFEGNPNKEELRRRFVEMASYMKGSDEMPLLFKNVHVFPFMQQIHEAVPEVKYIYLKRNEEQVIQSMLKAYYDLGYFNAIPKALEGQENQMGPLPFIVRQFIETEKGILVQKEQIAPSNWIEWSYEDLCSNCKGLLGDLLEQHTSLSRDKVNMDYLTSPLKASFSQKVSDKEVKEIKDELIKLGYERA